MIPNIPTRILIFSTSYYPFVAGAEVAVKELTDRFGSDYECDLITGRFTKNIPPIEKIGAVTVYRVGIGHPFIDKILLPFWGAFVVHKLHQKKPYDCFWSVMVSFASGAGYIYNSMRRLFRKKKIPMVLTLQEGDSENHLQYKWGGLIHLSWKLSLKQTDFLTGLSNFLLHRAEIMGYDGEKLLVPNGVDLVQFTTPVSSDIQAQIQKDVEKKDGDIFLVTTSRLVQKNAVDDIISALSYLPAHIKLLVIGVGPDSKKIKDQVNTLGLVERVSFLGFVDHTRIPEYFSISNIFVRPSRSEGFGNSFIEAMASKLPVIATPVGGIPDFIDDKETGIFCSPDNPKSIAEAVTLLLSDKVLSQKIVEKAYDRVVERYDWSLIAQKMKQSVFDRLLKKSKMTQI